MQASLRTVHQRLDELMIEALAAHQQLPVGPPSETHVSIEVVDEEDASATTRFVRISAPYECVDIAPLTASNAALPLPRVGRSRPRTFVRTVPAGTPPAGVTVQFDKAWFEQPDDAIAAIEEPPVDMPRSWWWLVASLAVAAVAVTVLAIVSH